MNKQQLYSIMGAPPSERKKGLSPVVKCSQINVDSFEGQFTYRKKQFLWWCEANKQDTHHLHYDLFHGAPTTKTFTDCCYEGR